MPSDLTAQPQFERKRTLPIVADCLKSLVLIEEDWEGDKQISISHCFVPGQNTDCGEFIAITAIRTKERELSGICRGCCSDFIIRFSDFTIELQETNEALNPAQPKTERVFLYQLPPPPPPKPPPDEPPPPDPELLGAEAIELETVDENEFIV